VRRDAGAGSTGLEPDGRRTDRWKQNYRRTAAPRGLSKAKSRGCTELHSGTVLANPFSGYAERPSADGGGLCCGSSGSSSRRSPY
jgi:hypothetical protein